MRPPSPAPPRPVSRWFGGPAALIAALWTATALTLLLPTSHVAGEAVRAGMARGAGMPAPPSTPWLTYLLRELPVWYSWVLLLPAIVWLSRRFPIDGRRRTAHLLAHTLCAIAAVAVAMLITVTYHRALFSHLMPPTLRFGQLYLLGLTQHGASLSIVYASIAAVQHAARYSRDLEQRTLDAARLEARLAAAQLDALRPQIQPHFLFNTLNTIVSLIHTSTETAERTVLRLSHLLRRSLRGASAHEVPLREELEFLEEYAAIQQTRFGERLAVRYHVAPETLDLRVPPLLLQPLVENAIRHGLQPRAEPGTVCVRAAVEGGRLVLEVVDDGVGPPAVPPRPGRDGGIGLRNTRARLRQLYGGDHAFTLERATPRGTRVRVELPARPAAARAEAVEAADGD